MKTNILFVCIHNSFRSQMAEALATELLGDMFWAESAGLEPGTLSPLAVQVLAEKGLDISHKTTKDVFEIYRSGKQYEYVITVCDETAAERCPIFPGVAKRLHWGFPDATQSSGTDEEKLAQSRQIRNDIEARLIQWREELLNTSI